jgi:hypothetical protein
MTEDGFRPKYCRGQEVYVRIPVSFFGVILGYIRRLSGEWIVVVETNQGNVYHVREQFVQLVKKLPELIASKY